MNFNTFFIDKIDFDHFIINKIIYNININIYIFDFNMIRNKNYLILLFQSFINQIF